MDSTEGATELVFEPSQTTHWKNLFPSKMMLLGSQNLNPGEELIATISSVEAQEIKNKNGKPDIVPVARFENAPPMVLNIPNPILIGPPLNPSIGRFSKQFLEHINIHHPWHKAIL